MGHPKFFLTYFTCGCSIYTAVCARQQKNTVSFATIENGPSQVSRFLWKSNQKRSCQGTWWGQIFANLRRAKQSSKLPMAIIFLAVGLPLKGAKLLNSKAISNCDFLLKCWRGIQRFFCWLRRFKFCVWTQQEVFELVEEAIKRSELFPCAESPKMNAGGVLSTSEFLGTMLGLGRAL